ncbi:MAG: sigma-70 family RNA polymerase sigma factor [Lachnospiraceae bacterium]|nr:sigma-70 family RNA polymerase sigma factor [Lachnospiraceae bacterium]
MNSKEQLEVWMTKYESLVFSICYRMTGDYFAAQDITQETFLSAFRHASDFDGMNEKAWLCRIASNKCVDYMRNAGRRQIPTEDEKLPESISHIGRPEEETLEQEVRQQLLNACRSLSPPYNRIAEDYFYLEKKAETIAGEQSQKVKTIQTRIYRARNMLREIYRKKNIDGRAL